MKRLTVMNIVAFKGLARCLGKKMGLQHSRSLELLSRAHGYPTYNDLAQEIKASRRKTIALLCDQGVWEEQLRLTYGEVCMGVFSPHEPVEHFQRICEPLKESPEGVEILAFEQALQSWTAQRRLPSQGTNVLITYKKRRRSSPPDHVDATVASSLNSMGRLQDINTGCQASTSFTHLRTNSVAQLTELKRSVDEELLRIVREIEDIEREKVRQDVIDEVHALMARYSICVAEI